MTKSRFPSKRHAWRVGWLASAGVIAACVLAHTLSSRSSFAQAPPAPVFTNPTAITNPYLPLSSLKQGVLEGTVDKAAIQIERKTLQGVTRAFTVNGQ